MKPKYLTVALVAEMHKTTHKTVMNAIRAGDIRATEVSGVGGIKRYIIRETDAHEWLGPLPHGTHRT